MEQIEYSVFGIFISILALIIFTVLLYKVMGLFCLIVGPMVTLMALRPCNENGRWAWQKK